MRSIKNIISLPILLMIYGCSQPNIPQINEKAIKDYFYSKSYASVRKKDNISENEVINQIWYQDVDGKSGLEAIVAGHKIREEKNELVTDINIYFFKNSFNGIKKIGQLKQTISEKEPFQRAYFLIAEDLNGDKSKEIAIFYEIIEHDGIDAEIRVCSSYKNTKPCKKIRIPIFRSGLPYKVSTGRSGAILEKIHDESMPENKK